MTFTAIAGVRSTVNEVESISYNRILTDLSFKLQIKQLEAQLEDEYQEKTAAVKVGTDCYG